MMTSGSIRAWVETFDTALTALQRHAAVAKELRDRGWETVDYSHTPAPDPHVAPLPIAA